MHLKTAFEALFVFMCIMKKKKNKKWIRRRHQVVRNIINIVLGGYTKRKYGIKVEKFNNPDKKPHLVLYNHQTGFDQFFLGMAFHEHLYYVASEDIFSMGFLSKLIKFLVAPIPIKKQTNDPRAVITCIKVAKEGGSIAIAPEGNRTFSGKTEYIKPSITALAKHLGLPIAFFRIEGGYGVQPRWSDVVRKGSMRAYVSRVMSPDEYKDLSDEELYDIICRELYNDEAHVDTTYRHKALAEYLERAIYVCPDCGISEFESHGDVIECLRCKKKVRYLPTKELAGIDCDFPFRFVKNWYEYQSEFINSLDLNEMSDEAISTDRITLSSVILYQNKETLLEDATLSLFKNGIEIQKGEKLLKYPFDELSAVTVLGKNKVNLYFGKDVYQISGTPRFCALKYVNLYYRYTNLKKGEKDAKFLGL